MDLEKSVSCGRQGNISLVSLNSRFLYVLFFYVTSFKLSTQGIPKDCGGTFDYTIKQTHDSEHVTGGNYTFCGNTTCDVVVNQDAHRINLTVFQNKEVLVVKSVYVPAVGESKFKCFLLSIFNGQLLLMYQIASV